MMMMKLPWWANLEWRTRKRVMLALCAVEFPLTVAGLTLFGIADPNTYRTKLWKEGAVHGWNSDPIEILYAYANHRPIAVPAPWAQFVTDFNIVVSVLSMFILLAKTTMYITHAFPPLCSTIVHAALVILWAVSISQQTASDYSDPDHPSKVPWYLTRGCGDPVNPSLQGYCQQAKASLAVTVLMLVLFLTYFVFSLVSSIPSSGQKAAQREKEEEAMNITNYDDKRWEYELDQMRALETPTFQPFTPRTTAFNALEGRTSPRPLNRDLPLRHHIAMGDEIYS